MTLMEWVAVIGVLQSALMLVATFYMWATGRENKNREREHDELRERVERIEQRLWDLR